MNRMCCLDRAVLAATIGAAAASLLVPALALRAQNVTLPSVRVTEVSPEVQLLRRVIIAARAMYDSTSSDQAVVQKARDMRRVTERFLLAPYTQRQLADLAGAKTPEDSVKALAGFRPGEEDRQALNSVRFLAREVDRRNQKAVDALTLPVSEYETGQLLESLRASEDNPERAALLDSLSRIARAAVIDRKVRTRVLWPIHTREQAIKFWQQPGFSTLNVGAVSGTAQNGAVFTELASPFLHSVRLSVNAVIAVAEDEPSPAGDTPTEPPVAAPEESDANNATVTRFVNGGGLLNVGFAWPAVHVGLPNGALDAMLLLAPHIGGTIPAFGAGKQDTTLVYDAGTELHLKSVDLADGVGVFAQARVALAGGSGNFGELLGMDRNAAFGYATVSAGLLLGGRYLITANRTVAGPSSLRSLGWQIGMTAIRKADR